MIADGSVEEAMIAGFLPAPWLQGRVYLRLQPVTLHLGRNAENHGLVTCWGGFGQQVNLGHAALSSSKRLSWVFCASVEALVAAGFRLRSFCALTARRRMSVQS